jgi:hypothetical protein
MSVRIDTLARPMTLAVGHRDPARAARDDVEQDQSLGSRVERVGQGQGRGLERERLGQLGAEEDRALQAELLERGSEHDRRRLDGAHHRSGGTVRGSGVSVIHARSVRSDTRS